VLTGTTTPPVTRTVTSTPAATFSSLVQGASGTLTLKNLPTGSSVSAVSFGDATFSGLPAAADSTGTATVAYAIPADADLGTFPVSVTTTSPAATYTLAGSKISPDPSPVGGEDDFKLLSNGTGLFQGLYQTAFSASEDALFATASSGTGTSEDGYLYKLDAETLAVETTVHPKELTAGGETGKAPYGVGVDDVNGTVWVSNTRTNTAAVYDADDLTLLKQFPTGTISHSRDVVYDPSTNQVFISSASEGTTGNGYISVFEGGDNDGDGTPYEKITDIQTGPRTDFNPVSLSLADGTLVSPSLQSNKVAKIDTATLAVTYLTITGIDVGGRGASGIAYDASGNRLFIASQNSDEVVIADATTGATLKEVGTGTQALNVAWDDVHQLAYVTNLGSTNVTVLDEEGDKVANLPITRSNHVSVDGRGNAYVADKNTANKVWKIAPTTEAMGGVEITDPTAAGITGAEATTPLSVTVAFGEPIHVGGAGFLVTDKSSGSKIAVKPASVPGSPTIAQIDADDLGTWSADVSYPSTWATGSTHYLRLLTGSLKTGDKPRSIAVKVTVTGAPADPQTPSGSGGGGGGGGGSSTTAEQTDTTEPAATPAPPVESAPSATVPPAGTPATTTPLVLKWATPKVAGRSTVGSKLTANVGSWTAGTKLTYQWFANGKKIAGATKRTFTLTKKQQGQKITVKVTGRKTGYRTVVKTSHATAKVAQRR
jgi:DNA-binding beta-propeller fold protein YncE